MAELDPVQALRLALEEALRHVEAARATNDEATTRADALEVVTQIVDAMHDLKDAEEAALARWRDWGATWSDIGNVYGITRGAAYNRFAHGAFQP